jgi:hypothetical protein
VKLILLLQKQPYFIWLIVNFISLSVTLWGLEVRRWLRGLVFEINRNWFLRRPSSIEMRYAMRLLLFGSNLNIVKGNNIDLLREIRSRGSSVGIATGYGLDGWGSIPGSARFFSSPHRRYRFCGQPSLLPNGYRGHFLGGKAAGAWSWPLLI